MSNVEEFMLTWLLAEAATYVIEIPGFFDDSLWKDIILVLSAIPL